MDLKEQSDYGEKHKNSSQATNYEYNVYADDSYYSYIWEIEKNILIKEICSIRKIKIKYLDFACGTGRILSFVEQYVTESTGIDVSKNMLNIAKEKVRKSLLLNYDLTINDIIGDKQYDLITAFRFFLNAQEDLREKTILLLSEKLSNDGLFIFNTHGNTFSYYLLPVILGKLGIKQVKLNHLSYFKMLKLINKTNLKLSNVYGTGFIPSLFYRWFKPWRRFFVTIEKTFSNCRLIKYFGSDLIFICTIK